MTRIYALLCLSALLLGSCSTLNPVLKPIANCAGKTVSAADANEAFDDLLTQNWVDLAAEGVRLGYDVLACIITDITTQTPGLAPAATEFKTLHAVEFRAAGVSACNDFNAKPGDRLPGTSAGRMDPARAPAKVQISAMECDAHCGAPLSGLVTPSGCSCQRKVDGKLRWVPLATVAAR